jgi:hypothetical protein
MGARPGVPPIPNPALSHRIVEATWHGNPKDGLRFLGMTREVAFPMRILNEDKPAGGNVPELSHHWSRTRQRRRASP